MQTGRLDTEEIDSTAAAEFTAYQVGVDIAAEHLMTLVERIKSSTAMLADISDQPASNGEEGAGLLSRPTADETDRGRDAGSAGASMASRNGAIRRPSVGAGAKCSTSSRPDSRASSDSALVAVGFGSSASGAPAMRPQ